MPMDANEPCYIIGVVARMVGVHAQTLRYYERMGLIEPYRSKGNIRFYSLRDIERIRMIKTLMDDMGVNLAGVEIILRMRERIRELERETQRLSRELEALRSEKERQG